MQPHNYKKGKSCKGCRSYTTRGNGIPWCNKLNIEIKSTVYGNCKDYKPKYKKSKKVKKPKQVYASREEELKAKGWIKKDEQDVRSNMLVI